MDEYKNIEKLGFTFAAAIDSQLRALTAVMEPLNDLELDYVKTKLKSEQDPLLATVWAQMACMRELPAPEEAESK